MITIVSVTGYAFNACANAIELSASRCPYVDRLLLVTTQKPCSFSGDVVLVPEMDRSLYSRYLLTQLPDLIETSHALIVQPDGYVLNAHLWDDEFLNWDYVGAPWPSGEVGNGGFSLRTREFLLRSKDRAGDDNEDALVCRPPIEGMRYAPSDVALRFSYELPVEGYPGWGLGMSFGFHGTYPDRKSLVLS